MIYTVLLKDFFKQYRECNSVNTNYGDTSQSVATNNGNYKEIILRSDFNRYIGKRNISDVIGPFSE